MHTMQLHRASSLAAAGTASARPFTTNVLVGRTGVCAAPRLLRGRNSNGVVAPAQQQQRRPAVVTAASRGGSGPPVADRAIATLPYLLPLLDALPYGRFLMLQYPALAAGLAPLGPLNALYHGVPFGSFVVFLGVYAGLVNNQNLDRFVRVNAAQAVLLDILLILPRLVLDALAPPTTSVGLAVTIQADNAVFVAALVFVAYGLYGCAAGSTSRLPLVADAAEAQVR